MTDAVQMRFKEGDGGDANSNTPTQRDAFERAATELNAAQNGAVDPADVNYGRVRGNPSARQEPGWRLGKRMAAA